MATVSISVLAETRKAVAGIDAVNNKLTSMGGFVKKAVGGFVAFEALKIGKDLFTDSIAEAREAQKVMANTQAVIKATGGAAGMSAKDVDKLSSRLSGMTGIDDEVIAGGANLLLTFKNVKKEGGIFDRATASAVDLSAAGFGSVESASKTLGKALNDPIKGVSALSKQGVTFTDVQKKQIKGFVDAGKAGKAQALILKEVESQVGGQAAAQATAGEKLQVTIGNIKESIGAKLLPILDRMATYLAAKLPGWLATAGEAFNTVKGYVTPVVDTIRGFFTSVDSGSAGTGSKIAQFQATVSTVFESVKSIFSSAVTIITSLWQMFGSTIVTYLSNSLTNVMTALRGAFTVIKGIFDVFAGIFTGDWSRVWSGLKSIVSGAFTVIKALISQSWNMIATVFKVAGTTIKAIVTGAFNGLKSAASAGVGALIDYVQSIPGKIKDAFSGAKTLLSAIGGFMVDGLKNGLSGAWHKVTDYVASAIDLIPKKIRELMGIASPSKVTTKLGEFISAGLAKGISVGTTGVVSSVINLAKVINETLPKNIKKPKAVDKWYAEHNKSIKAGSKAVLQNLKSAALDRLNAAKQEFADYAKAVKDSAITYAGLASMTLGENQNLSGDNITQFLTDRLANISNFNSQLAALKNKGVSDDIYNQIVQMGVEQGSGYANAILNSTPAAIAQINSLQAQINNASTALGNSTAQVMYGSGVQAAQGFYNGLNSMLEQIKSQGIKIAKSLIKALKKALGIKSPSREMRKLGKFAVQGLDIGLETRSIKSKGVELASALTTGFKSPQLDAQLQAGYAASDTKGAKQVVINVHLDNSMTQEQMGVAYNKAIKSAEKVGLI